ncbi:ribonuclease 1-like [Fagus crenata]
MKPIILFLFFFPATLLAYNFDYYQLVLQWPRTYCWDKNNCIDYPQNFTIHGLWPTCFTGCSPRSCYGSQNGPPWVDPGKPYTLNLSWISSETFQTLEEEWPDLLGNDESFWGRQWYMHGTCSGNSVEDYFNNALILKRGVDLLSFLEKGGIMPGDSSYQLVTTIKQAIKKETGYEPHLWCKPEGPNQLLLEVSICFDSSHLKIMSCPKALQRLKSACSSNLMTSFPKKMDTVNDTEHMDTGTDTDTEWEDDISCMQPEQGAKSDSPEPAPEPNDKSDSKSVHARFSYFFSGFIFPILSIRLLFY